MIMPGAMSKPTISGHSPNVFQKDQSMLFHINGSSEPSTNAMLVLDTSHRTSDNGTLASADTNQGVSLRHPTLRPERMEPSVNPSE